MTKNKPNFSKAQIWYHLCTLLSDREINLDQLSCYSEVDWMTFITLSNMELVSAEVSHLFSKRADVPADIKAYFQAVADANRERNDSIARQCREIANIAGRNNVVFLKGAAWLIDDRSDGNRMMRDIDILVPFDLAPKIEEVLGSNGYTAVDVDLASDHPHGPPLIHPSHCAAVEVHKFISCWPHLIPAEEILKDATSGEVGLTAPSLEHRILHNVLHAQKQNGEWLAGKVSLRDALDLKRLLAQEDSRKIDWSRLIKVSRQRGTYTILASALLCAHMFLGAELPKPFMKNRTARLHVLRCKLQKKLPFWERLERSLQFVVCRLAWKRVGHGFVLVGHKERMDRIGRWLGRQGLQSKI